MSDPLRRWRLATFGALLLAVALGSALATVLLAAVAVLLAAEVAKGAGDAALTAALQPALAKINGAVFNNEWIRECGDVAQQVPIERLLIETDCPYLAPMPYRGKSNEPAYLPHVAVVLADLHQMSVAALAEQTSANFDRLRRDAAEDKGRA